MQFIQVIGGLLAVAAIITLFIRYNPKLDLITTNNKYTLLLWYNKYNMLGNKSRTYTVIF